MPSESDQVKRVIAALPHRTLQIQEHLALALMVMGKWDRTYAQYGAVPTPVQAAASDNFTNKELSDYREAAARMTSEFAACVSQPKEGWLIPVLQGVLASFFYSILLIVIGLIFYFLEPSDIAGAINGVKDRLEHSGKP
jgi:hypothetical protein